VYGTRASASAYRLHCRDLCLVSEAEFLIRGLGLRIEAYQSDSDGPRSCAGIATTYLRSRLFFFCLSGLVFYLSPPELVCSRTVRARATDAFQIKQKF